MNQPQLGLKVAEVRQQKGFTQQQLAEYCEVSTRTIQRIEGHLGLNDAAKAIKTLAHIGSSRIQIIGTGS